MMAILGRRIAVRAHAPIRTDRVMASKSALVCRVQTFVDIFARLSQKLRGNSNTDEGGTGDTQTCIGPGANPAPQVHSKLPTKFVQEPLPQMFALATHSSKSTNFERLWSETVLIRVIKISCHAHRYKSCR